MSLRVRTQAPLHTNICSDILLKLSKLYQDSLGVLGLYTHTPYLVARVYFTYPDSSSCSSRLVSDGYHYSSVVNNSEINVGGIATLLSNWLYLLLSVPSID